MGGKKEKETAGGQGDCGKEIHKEGEGRGEKERVRNEHREADTHRRGERESKRGREGDRDRKTERDRDTQRSRQRAVEIEKKTGRDKEG